MNMHVYGVGELNFLVKDILENTPTLHNICVVGEISNHKVYPSGHHYFSMKDADGSVSCVMFRGSASRLRFAPANGMKVTVVCSATVYPVSGSYQLNVTSMMPEGTGDLQVAFEQLKEKLSKEGLFDTAHKKPIPRYPAKIAVITSGAGAAVHDVIRVLGKRWPVAKILVLPVAVQGVEAPPQIVGAIRYANKYRVADLIITGRGGGSMEDLWAFNDERVARAIYDSEIPVISAVGHEPDVTIADYVADLRAATPSNGAELAGPDREELLDLLRSKDSRMRLCMRKKLDLYEHRLRELSGRSVITDPSAYIGSLRMRLDMLSGAMLSAEERKLAGVRSAYRASAAKLDALSPLKVIARGYAVAEKKGAILRSVNDVENGEQISIKMSDGTLGCRVEDIKHGEKRTDL